MTEKQFENKIKNFLKSHDIWYLKVWGGGYMKSGVPDILTCVNGYFVAIEVKGPNGKPSELQKYNIRKINESNGIGLILYPNQFEEFKELITELLGR
ncbi:VRR-NUC domain-containing protein [Tissierellaceae bacterium HCP3S3_D8]